MEPEIVCESGISALLEHYSVVGHTNAQASRTDATGLSYCIFRSGDDHFGIPLELVEEIVSQPVIHEVPASPPFFLGTLIHGAETLPVIDLAMCATPLADPRYCLLLRLASGDDRNENPITIAIAVDELVWPTATRGLTSSAEMRFAPYEAASRFISGRISWGSLVAWALDPCQLTTALFSAVMD